MVSHLRYRLVPLEAALASAIALLLVSQSMHSVAGQGLDVSGDLLGAGAVATANAFADFEDALSLAAIGGRGRGSRGGSGNLGGFRDVTDYQQLQAAYYYIGTSAKVYESSNASQTPGRRNYVPAPADQELCNSCVGQAVATAVQMSLAYTLWQDVGKFQVSARNLYYCSSGGRTCLTGWDIQPALAQLELYPGLLLPVGCLANVTNRNEAEISDWGLYCPKAQAQCSGITNTAPLYKCTYKSLSSFYQIQQHIRKHGAVITRVAVPDDFNVQFNTTVRDKNGLELPPYSYNASAKYSYGHAAVIVGYDNDNFTWTLLNSWGRGNAPQQTRLNGGVTADGMFKVQMGLLGVGTPEKSYGVSCEPAAGTPLNLNNEQPWIRIKGKRYPVQEISSGNNTCFKYKTGGQESVSSIVDQLELPIRMVVASNQKVVGQITNLTYKFETRLRAEELASILRIVDNVTSDVKEKEFQPFFKCLWYGSQGEHMEVRCEDRNSTGNTLCTTNGTVGCTLYYQDINVTEVLPSGTALTVCNADWETFSVFNKVAYVAALAEAAQNSKISPNEVAVLQRIFRMYGGKPDEADTAGQTLFQCINDAPERDANFWVYNDKGKRFKGYALYWTVSCSLAPNITDNDGFPLVVDGLTAFTAGIDEPIRQPDQVNIKLTQDVGYMLLSLEHLTFLKLQVYNGSLPAQIGGLHKLASLSLTHFCLGGGLPPQWISGLPNITGLEITPVCYCSTEGAAKYVDPNGQACGVTGSIPATWFNVSTPPITYLNLAGNRLQGQLPVQLGNWKNLTYLDLSSNMLTREIPASWSTAKSLDYIDLSNNMLSGVFPLTWASLTAAKYVTVNNNRNLEGCIPLYPSFIFVNVSGTQMTGLCRSNATQIAQLQVEAMKNILPRLLMRKQNGRLAKKCEDPHVYDQFIHKLLLRVAKLGQLVTVAKQPIRIESGTLPGLSARVTIEISEGAEYITKLKIQEAALDMLHLAPLLRGLPGLRSFECVNCYCRTCAEPACAKGSELPADLPLAAPQLQSLALVNSNLDGRLPDEWGDWGSLVTLGIVYNNNLSGSIPQSWKGMFSLEQLELAGNNLTGPLPPQFGMPGTKLRRDLYMNVRSNPMQRPPGNTSGVPQSYAYFTTGRLYVGNTSLVNPQLCAPGTLAVDVGDLSESRLVANCGNEYMSALNRLRDFLSAHPGGNTTLLQTWYKPEADNTGTNNPPAHCSGRVGVACDYLYRVVKLDLSALKISFNSAVKLTQLLEQIKNLKELGALSMHGINVAGDLGTAGFARFSKLQHLDISSNPGIEGTLPSYLFELTALRTLNISDTAVSGQLPPTMATLQELREFRAARCINIEGPLPVQLGLLSNLEVFEITNSSIQGPLPQEWADPEALATAAAQLMLGAKKADVKLKKARQQQQQQQQHEEYTTKTFADTGANSTTVGAVAPSGTGGRMQSAASAAGAQDTSAMAAEPKAQLGLFNLKKLIIANNSAFKSQLPGIYSNLGQLAYVDLSANELTGSLPGEWAALKELQVLALGSNKLGNTLPKKWTVLTKLRMLGLQDNQLTGIFPNEYLSLRQLAILDIRNNGALNASLEVWKKFVQNGYSLQCLLPPEPLSPSDKDTLTQLAQGRDPDPLSGISGLGFLPTDPLCELENLVLT